MARFGGPLAGGGRFLGTGCGGEWVLNCHCEVGSLREFDEPFTQVALTLDADRHAGSIVTSRDQPGKPLAARLSIPLS